MPTHFIHYSYYEQPGDRAHVFHTGPDTAYRIRDALLAAGAIDPEHAEPRAIVHFRELFDDKLQHHVLPADIMGTVRAWSQRIPGVQVHPPRGLSEGERTKLTAAINRPRDGQIVERLLPDIDGDELADSFVAWAHRAALEGGGFIVVP